MSSPAAVRIAFSVSLKRKLRTLVFIMVLPGNNTKIIPTEQKIIHIDVYRKILTQFGLVQAKTNASILLSHNIKICKFYSSIAPNRTPKHRTT